MRHSLLSGAGALALIALSTSANAQVVLDGTTGSARALTGPDYRIGAELGRRADGNLFHSFERFGLRTGESATFSGPDGIANVIGRVTGGERSDIDGVLRSTIVGADLWFLNPAGVVFGPNARLDLQGSFHVSTADELRFADGATFSATDPGASRLTMAPPEAFGFLGAMPAGIMVDRSRLRMLPGEALSLIGGDITVTAGNDGTTAGREAGIIQAETGRITLAAIGGSGAVEVGDGALSATDFGDIRLTDQALVDVSGDGGGTVRIRAGRFVVESSRVVADNTGPRDGAGGIDLEAGEVSLLAGSVLANDARGSGRGGRTSIAVDQLAVHEDSAISSSSGGLGRPGSIRLDAGRLVLDSGAIISIASPLSSPESLGGDITVTARSEILITGRAGRATGISGITSATLGAGNAGSVRVEAPILRMPQHALIDSSTFGAGNAGAVTVEVDRLTLGPGASITSVSVNSSSPDVQGSGGRVRVVASEAIEMAGDLAQGFISGVLTTTATAGPAGSIEVETPFLRIGDGGLLQSGTLASGRSGSIRIDADRVEILGQGLVTTASLAAGEDAGEAGGIVVMARDALRLSGGGSVSAETARADAGDIEIRVGRLLHMEDGAITTSAAGGRGGGGDIRIDPEFVVLDDSRIVANAREGGGGNIRIVADNFIATPDSVISASSDLGTDGTVVVEAPEQDVSGGLVALPVGFVDASALLPASCAARRSAHLSSFTATGRGGLPPGPDTPLPGFYTLGLGAFGAPPAAAAPAWPAWGALAGIGSVRTTVPLMPRVPCGATRGRSTG